MNYRILSVAARDLTDAIEFYERQSGGLGEQFLDEYESVIRRILDFPEAWTPISPNQRRCLVRRFPYAVLYAHDGNEILVTGIADLRRDPGIQANRNRKL